MSSLQFEIFPICSILSRKSAKSSLKMTLEDIEGGKHQEEDCKRNCEENINLFSNPYTCLRKTEDEIVELLAKPSVSYYLSD